MSWILGKAVSGADHRSAGCPDGRPQAAGSFPSPSTGKMEPWWPAGCWSVPNQERGRAREQPPGRDRCLEGRRVGGFSGEEPLGAALTHLNIDTAAYVTRMMWVYGVSIIMLSNVVLVIKCLFMASLHTIAIRHSYKAHNPNLISTTCTADNSRKYKVHSKEQKGWERCLYKNKQWSNLAKKRKKHVRRPGAGEAQAAKCWMHLYTHKRVAIQVLHLFFKALFIFFFFCLFHSLTPCGTVETGTNKASPRQLRRL